MGGGREESEWELGGGGGRVLEREIIIMYGSHIMSEISAFMNDFSSFQ